MHRVPTPPRPPQIGCWRCTGAACSWRSSSSAHSLSSRRLVSSALVVHGLPGQPRPERRRQRAHHSCRRRPAGRIGVLVCDFDDTCTQKDTIGVLMGVAAEAAAKVRAGDWPAAAVPLPAGTPNSDRCCQPGTAHHSPAPLLRPRSVPAPRLRRMRRVRQCRSASASSAATTWRSWMLSCKTCCRPRCGHDVPEIA